MHDCHRGAGNTLMQQLVMKEMLVQYDTLPVLYPWLQCTSNKLSLFLNLKNQRTIGPEIAHLRFGLA